MIRCPLGRLPARCLLTLCLVVVFMTSGCTGGGGGTPQPPSTLSPPGGGSSNAILAPVPPSPKGSVNPTAISFGDVTVGSSFSLTVAITNVGNANLEVTQVTLTGSSSISFSGLTLPLSVAPGQSVPFSIQFAPLASGAASATVSFSSNSSTVIPPLTLTGNGVTAPTAQLSVSPAAINFGSVTVGSGTNQQVTLANTGGANVTVSAIAISGAGFSIVTAPTLPFSLAPGQSQPVIVRFAPTATGAATGQVLVTHDAPNSPGTVALAGTAIASSLQLTVTPTSIDFGNAVVGSTTSSQTTTLTNAGNSNITVTAVSVSAPGFAVGSMVGLPFTLTPGQSVDFFAAFAPTVAGAATSTISFVSNASNSPTVVNLAGNGIAAVRQLVLNPTNVDFGDVIVGTTATQTVTATNTGNANVVITAVSATGAGFSAPPFALPFTLNPGQSVNFTATFAPTATGAAAGTISLTSNATPSPTVLTVAGNGVPLAATLTPTPTSISFGNVIQGASQIQMVTLTNTGNTNATISAANVTGSGFSITGLTVPQVLAPSQSVVFSLQFAPASTGPANGSISVVSTATNSPTTISLTGTGVAQTLTLALNPVSINFGQVVVATNASQSATVTNTGNANVTITSANVTGGAAGFGFTGLAFPLTLAPGQSATFTAQFTPAGTGTVNGSVSLVSNASNSPSTLSLSGQGIAAPAPGFLTVSPSTFSFGNVFVGGTGGPQTFTLTNTGGTAVNVSSFVLAGGAAGFSTNIAPPFALAPAASTTFTAQFGPVGAGAAAGSITITSDATNTPTVVTLSGTGVTPVLQLNVSPSSLNFGGVIVGSNSSQTVTMTNAGNQNLTITAANVTGAAYSINPALGLPLTLTPGQSQNFTVRFAPAGTGAQPGSVSLVSNASNSPTAVTLSGSGIAAVNQVIANPTSLNFGNVFVGANNTQPVTITNTGNVNVTLNSAAPLPAGFSIIGLTFPQTLTPGQVFPFSVRFAPAVAGSVSGSLSIASTAANTPTIIGLQGTGVTPTATLAANPTSIAFGNVFVGANVTQSVTVTNTGNQSVTINTATPTGAGITILGLTVPLTLTAGQSTNFTVRFAPAAAGAVNGNVSLASTASNSPTVITLTGTGVTPTLLLSASPVSFDFGNVAIGSSATQSITLTNTGNQSVTVSALNMTGAAFSITPAVSLPLTLSAGQSSSFTVRFAPTASGGASGSVSAVSNATNSPANVSLAGTGTVPTSNLLINPNSINFGGAVVGSQVNVNVTLTNSGSATVTVTQANLSGSSTFSVVGLTLPLTLSPAQSAIVTIRFSPTALGAVSGGVSFVSNASNSPGNVTLSGTGSSGVSLSWNTSPTSGITDYNVYRGTVSGGPYTKINSSVVKSLTYFDTTVSPGTTYFYVVTAVDSFGVESAFSSPQLTVVIP